MAAEVRLLPPRVPKRVTSAPARCEGQQYPLRKSDGTLRGLNTNLGDLLPWLRKDGQTAAGRRRDGLPPSEMVRLPPPHGGTVREGECPICCTEFGPNEPVKQAVRMMCGNDDHYFCDQCFQQHVEDQSRPLRIVANEGAIPGCLYPECLEKGEACASFPANIISWYVPTETYELFMDGIRLHLRRVIERENAQEAILRAQREREENRVGRSLRAIGLLLADFPPYMKCGNCHQVNELTQGDCDATKCSVCTQPFCAVCGFCDGKDAHGHCAKEHGNLYLIRDFGLSGDDSVLKVKANIIQPQIIALLRQQPAEIHEEILAALPDIGEMDYWRNYIDLNAIREALQNPLHQPADALAEQNQQREAGLLGGQGGFGFGRGGFGRLPHNGFGGVAQVGFVPQGGFGLHRPRGFGGAAQGGFGGAAQGVFGGAAQGGFGGAAQGVFGGAAQGGFGGAAQGGFGGAAQGGFGGAAQGGFGGAAQGGFGGAAQGGFGRAAQGGFGGAAQGVFGGAAQGGFGGAAQGGFGGAAQGGFGGAAQGGFGGAAQGGFGGAAQGGFGGAAQGGFGGAAQGRFGGAAQGRFVRIKNPNPKPCRFDPRCARERCRFSHPIRGAMQQQLHSGFGGAAAQGGFGGFGGGAQGGFGGVAQRGFGGVAQRGFGGAGQRGFDGGAQGGFGDPRMQQRHMPVVEPTEENISIIEAIGFSRELATDALSATQNNVDAAVGLLVDR